MRLQHVSSGNARSPRSRLVSPRPRCGTASTLPGDFRTWRTLRAGSSPSRYRSSKPSSGWCLDATHRAPSSAAPSRAAKIRPPREALMPRAAPISGYRRPSMRRKRQRFCCSESPSTA